MYFYYGRDFNSIFSHEQIRKLYGCHQDIVW
jgi:hypothetical protein